MDAIQRGFDQLQGFVSSVQVDDSAVPYFKLALAFVVAEYVFHTYLDLRQRKVRIAFASCAGAVCISR